MITAERTRTLLDRYRTMPTASNPRPLMLSRSELPALCTALGMRKGAEIGVWKGAYSARFCAAGLFWLAVDPWAPDPDWLDARNESAALETAYQLACERLGAFPHATIVRATSQVAAALVPDGSLDVVYIDGNHQQDAVLADLEAWAPKVRPGGLVAGHDYRAYREKPAIQVVEAVQAYTTAQQIDPWFLLTRDLSPSFAWVVP